MLLKIPNILTAEEVIQARMQLDRSEWVDGKVTAGHQSAKAKNNQQITQENPVAREIGLKIISALEKNPLFISAALPSKVFPPLFNRYQGGHSFGNHVDNAIRQIPNTPVQIRTDLSATLFLAESHEYEGGELCIEDNFGVHSVKLPAGHMVLYPASSLHHVKPVTRGARVASFFWIQSMVRDDSVRTMLFDLDLAIQAVNRDMPQHPSAVSLTGVYHNLLRRYAEV